MTDDRDAGRVHGASKAAVAMLTLLILLAMPVAALAQSGQMKLALVPIGQAGSFFDLTMVPGETRNLEVEIANDGDAGLAVRTYAADVYTIINGGFGGRLRDEPETGTTRWLDYPTDVLQLAAGVSTRRSFTIVVPRDTGPGEYITSLVLENDEPIVGDGTVALNQIVRQAIGVVVTVPGQWSPALAIGEATHKVVVGRSVVSIAVENTGNVRLHPVVEFTLLDSTGARVSRATVPMDTFYAHTDTTVELSLAALLRPGTYSVELSLADAARGARADRSALTLIVEAPTDAAIHEGFVPALVDVAQGPGDGQRSIPVWAVVVLLGLCVAGALTRLGLVLRRRRHVALIQ
jgi:hypothetical protein